MMRNFCNLCDSGLIPAHMDQVSELKASANILGSLTPRVPNLTSLSGDDIELVGDLLITSYFGMLEKYDDIIENAGMSSLTYTQSKCVLDIAERRERIAKCL